MSTNLPIEGAGPIDRLRRPLRDLRVSVIDRCNLRCTYCMPKELYGERYEFMPRSELLTFEEITRLVQIFQSLGVVKVRLTGGEPLLRNSIAALIGMIRGVDGIEDIALTTNGILLPKLAGELYESGLDRLTVSLDSLDPETAAAMNGMDVAPTRILEGIRAAEDAGFRNLKVNAVIQRGVNDGSILSLAEHFRGTGIVLRFIEYMDVGNVNAWNPEEVASARELRDQIHAHYPLTPLDQNYPGEVARRYAYEDGQGEIGFITSVSNPFCAGCTRARLSADGKLYTCLFASEFVDIREPLRSGATDFELQDIIAGVWSVREDRYSEIRASGRQPDDQSKVEMYQIGG